MVINPLVMEYKWLGGGLEHGFYDFPFSWEWNVIIPTVTRSMIFLRGRLKPPTSFFVFEKLDVAGDRCICFGDF